MVFGSAEPVFWDVLRCRPVYLVEAGGSGVLRGLARRQADLAAKERKIKNAAEGVLSNRDNDHAVQHPTEGYVRTAFTPNARQLAAFLRAIRRT